MWLWEGLKKIVCWIDATLNLFGRSRPAVIEKKESPKIKPIIIPPLPTKREIVDTVKVHPHPYANEKNRPWWAKKLYSLTIEGQIPVHQLKNELDSHRLFHDAVRAYPPTIRPRGI